MKYNYNPLRSFLSYPLSTLWMGLLIFLFCGNIAFSQSVSITDDGSVANANAMLDIKSPAVLGKGLLIPRLTLAQRTVASEAGGLLDGFGDLNGGAAQGLLVYQTDGTQGFYYNTSTTSTPTWVQVGTGNSGWELTGNSGTSAATNFAGTIDAQDYVIRTNNTEIMRGLSGGGVTLSNVPTGGNAMLINMTSGVAASSTGLRIGSFPANANVRTGISVDLTGMQNSSGVSVTNVGATSMTGMDINSTANGNGTGVRIGASTTLGTGINIRGGTGVLYNALNAGSGTGVSIGGTTTPNIGISTSTSGASNMGGRFTSNTAGIGALGNSGTYAAPAFIPLIGLRGFAASNSNTAGDHHYGIHGSSERAGTGGSALYNYGVYGSAASNSTSQGGAAVGVFGTAATLGNGTTGAFGGLFNSLAGAQTLSLAAIGGGDVYLGSTDADRPSSLISFIGSGNNNTTQMHNARLSGSITMRETAATTDVVTIAAPADITTSYSMTLPSTQGAANSIMVNDGAGLLSWAPQSGLTGYIQNQVATDQAAGFRISGNGLFNGGQVSISNTTASPTANYNLTLAPSAGFGGLSIAAVGAGSKAINASATSASMDVIYANHTSASAGSAFYAVGGQIAQPVTTIGYLGYHSSGDNAYALFGNANLHATSWGLFAKGKAAITGNSSPAVGQTADLEIQNVTAAGTPPSTVLLRQTGSNTVAGTTLARIGMGDNHQLAGQARIEAIRDATGGAGDLPTAITFSTTLDNTTILSERMRISNDGTIRFNAYTTNGIVRTTGGTGILSSTGGAINLTSEVSGILPLANGGTNANLTATNGGLLWSNATQVQITPAGTANQILISNGAAAPTFVDQSTITGFIQNQTAADQAAGFRINGNGLFNGGRVGIGSATAPNSLLHLRGATTGLAKLTLGQSGAIALGDVVGQITGRADNVSNDIASIRFEASAAISAAGDTPSRITFHTTPVGSGTQSERLRITNGGFVGLNTGATNPIQRFEMKDGHLLLSNTGTASQLQLQGTGTGISTFKAGAQGATNINYTLPTSLPATTGILGSDASGALSWTSTVSGSGFFIATMKMARKTGTQTITNSATLANDPELVMAVEANSTYEFQAVLHFTNASPFTASGDAKIAIALPAGSSMKVGYIISSTQSATGSFEGAGLLLTSPNHISEKLTVKIGADKYSFCTVTGMIRTAGTAGNIQLQWAQFASNAVGTTLQSDSFIRVTKVE